jgi:N-acylglucosamine 2-epimerase
LDPDEMTAFSAYAEQYRRALREDVIPFWERHSLDRECGGYFTCLGRDGSVFDTDKFVWLQARQVWTFAMLYNRCEARPQWLAAARHGAEFLLRHGRAPGGAWYFALARDGRPLVQPYNVFSDCFAAMALGQFALAAGDERAAAVARGTYDIILRRRENPKGAYNKLVPGARPLKNFALPMILSNLVLEIEHLLPPAEAEARIDECLREVPGDFLDPERNLILENVAPGGGRVDSFDGRLLNPGHAIEAMGFLMDLGVRRGDRVLIDRAVGIVLATLEFAWDEKFGGLFYFLDRLGRPPQQPEWDQKLWWVHLETLTALALGFALTRRAECRAWFERVHEYAWSHFPDPEFGEWYGYLDRRGGVLLPLKGGKWKGCFHVPRALFRCWKIFESMEEK